MLSESGSLILSTTSTTNPCVINASKSDFTFSNINMRNVLGSAWDKYELFTMKVVTAAISGTMTLASTTLGVFIYNMAGLTWENVHYDTAYMSQNYVAIATFNAQVAGNSSQQNQLISNTGQSYNFRKCGDLVDLNFTTTTTNNTGGPSTFGVAGGTNVYCDVAFHLVFEPVIPGEMNECAFFGFNTISTITSQVGRTVSADRKEFNYPAFDMRRLCLNFWDKHEDFEIQMSFYNVVGAGTITQNNRTCLFQMNGLNFVNSATKNSNSTDKMGITTESPIVGTIVFPQSGSNHDAVMSYPVAPIQFKKDGDNVNLTITMKNNENSGLFAFTFGGNNPACVIGFFIKPIYKVEKATLFINTAGLTTTQTNLGIINSNSTQFTLNNVNMRQVCRSMWDKYKKFNIFLTGTTSNQAAAQALNGSFILQMEGLNFNNQTAYITSSNQTAVATLGIVAMGNVAGTPRTNGWQSGIVTTFYRDQDFVDLTLRALQIATGASFSNAPLSANFTFTIVGIPDDE